MERLPGTWFTRDGRALTKVFFEIEGGPRQFEALPTGQSVDLPGLDIMAAPLSKPFEGVDAKEKPVAGYLIEAIKITVDAGLFPEARDLIVQLQKEADRK